MPEWQIEVEEYLKRLDLTINEFERRIDLPSVRSFAKIVPLRDLTQVSSAPIPISAELLLHILRQTKTLDGRRPFSASTLQLMKLDPHQTKIGQRFVYRENYQDLLEKLPEVFNRFLIATGLGDLGTYFVFGKDTTGTPALACYIPPIVEKHGAELIVMDGIHRNFIAKQTGIALNVILVENIDLPFPCGPRPWSDIRVISLAKKPKDIHARYFDLTQGLFRDLKFVGING